MDFQSCQGELVNLGATAWGSIDLAQFKQIDADWTMDEGLSFVY